MKLLRTSIALFILASFALSNVAAQERYKRPFHIQHTFTKDNSFFRNDTTPNPKKKKWVTGLTVGGYAAAGILLGSAWYSTEDLAAFHLFDDSHEWQQMDKVGHALGGYHASKWMIDALKWSGVSKKKSLIYGGATGFLVMSSIEVFDGFGEKWGASLSDVGANFVGSAIAVGNQWAWNENRVQLKVSYIKSDYAGDPEFADLFGTSYPEWYLKDYNGQVIWMSFRLHSFLPEGKFKRIYPRWLNLAVGYGASGLEGGYDDPAQAYLDREYRQYYLSLDFDFSNIKTRSGFLNFLLQGLSVFRVPFPALQMDKNGVKVLPLR